MSAAFSGQVPSQSSSPTVFPAKSSRSSLATSAGNDCVTLLRFFAFSAVKKIQEISEKGDGTLAIYERRYATNVRFLTAYDTVTRLNLKRFEADVGASQSELLKVLTPQQRAALERLSGIPLEKKK